MNEGSLSVLVVNWNRSADLKRLLTDLGCQTQPADEIIVVDNGSDDDSATMVMRDFPKVRPVRLHKNTGLSFGRNVGIVATVSDLIVFLDNDVRIPDRRFLAKARKSAALHPDCGVISFQQITGIRTQPPIEFPTAVISLDELASMVEANQHPVPPRVFYEWFLFGGACLIRRAVLENVGLFDDGFGYGGEEWDFAYRCHAAGIRLLRDTGLWVVHMRSPEMRSKDARELILKNMVIAQARYMPLVDLMLFLVIQFSKSAWDALRVGRLRAFLFTCYEIFVSWRSQVAKKRSPVSRNAMRRFLFLRTHRPEDYSEVERADTRALDFYLSRARGSTPEQVDRMNLVVVTG